MKYCFLLLYSVCIMLISSKSYFYTNASEFSSNHVSITCDSLSELLHLDLQEGMLVQTFGYNSPNDNGGAKYLISSDASLVTDDFSIWELDNGLKAVLQYPSDGILNVAVAGIFPNTNISKKLNSLCMKNEYFSCIQFNDGIYWIDETVYLTSLCYKGTSNTELKVSPDYKSDYFRIFVAKPSNDNNSSLNIKFNNLKISFETTSDHILKDKEVVLLSISNAQSCLIDNCIIEAKQAQTNGDFIKVDVIWFVPPASQNIVIHNSTIKNLTCSSDDDTHRVGGCLWFKGDSTDDTFNQIEVSNCTFVNTTTDETIGFWNAYFTNIKISNCLLNNITHSSNNILSCFNGIFPNVSIELCDFVSHIETKNQIKMYKIIDTCSINITSCSFINAIKSNSLVPQINAFILMTNNNNVPIKLNIDKSKFYAIDKTGSAKSIINTWQSFNTCISISPDTITALPLSLNHISDTYIMGTYN